MAFMSGIIQAIEASFQAAAVYQKFDGVTNSNSEGYYFGYKHSQTNADVVLLTRDALYIMIRNASDERVWIGRRIA